MTKFNADEFNFEEEFNKKREEIKKPNILICGATGTGKSSFINEVFGKEIAKVGAGKPVTKGIKRYEDSEIDVILYDSEGYEIGEEEQEYFREEILSVIDRKREEHPNKLEEHIHEVWYFISAANKRVTDTDIEIIEEIKERKIPVVIALSQIDNVDEEELKGIIDVIKNELNHIQYFTICVTDDEEVEEAVKPYNQKDELIKWAIDNLDDTLQIAFVSSLNVQIDLVKETVNKKVVPIYVASAAAAAVVPIPIADSAALTTIQLSMAVHIMSVYGINRIDKAVTSFVGSIVISQIGKMLAKTISGNLLKLIPGIGTIIGGIVNTAVATTITTTLGYAISELCYRYCKAVLEGKDVQVSDFFNSDELKETINMVSENINK